MLWFGTGSMSQELMPAVNPKHMKILAFVDERTGVPTTFMDKPVTCSTAIDAYCFDYLLIACRPAELVVAKLRSKHNVPEKKLVSLDFESICRRDENETLHQSFEHCLEKYLLRHPGLHKGFFFSRLMESTWLQRVKTSFDAVQRYDDDFFIGSRLNTSQEHPEGTFGHILRPLALPNLSERWRSMQIETIARCDYRCFCCVSHKAKRAKGVMSKEDIALLTRQVENYSGVALLHHGGEPLLDTELPEKVALFRHAWPKAKLAFVSTLGVPVKEAYFDALWGNGLNEIEISFYGYNRKTYQSIHGVDKFALAEKNLATLLASQTRQSLNGKLRVRMLHLEENSLITDAAEYAKQAAAFRTQVSAYPGVRAEDTYLSSHSGQGPIERKRATLLPCSVAWGDFGTRINVTWDLNVVPCCQDFDNHIVLGNLRQSSLEEIFSGPIYTNFIQALWKEDFSKYPLCRNCERHVHGTTPELLRIFAWKIADLLLHLPGGQKNPFAVVGEERFAPALESFFKSRFDNCVDLSQLCELANQRQSACLFIAASENGQLDYYENIKKSGLFLPTAPIKIIPLNGISYYAKTEFALRMRKLYEDLDII